MMKTDLLDLDLGKGSFSIRGVWNRQMISSTGSQSLLVETTGAVGAPHVLHGEMSLSSRRLVR